MRGLGTRERRAIQTAKLYLRHQANMRSVAAEMNVSVWTVQHDLTKILPKAAPDLAAPVLSKIEEQRKERARRGGLATRGVARWRGWGRMTGRDGWLNRRGRR